MTRSSRESGRNRSFALCSRALDDLINGPKYSDILLLGNYHPTTCRGLLSAGCGLRAKIYTACLVAARRRIIPCQ